MITLTNQKGLPLEINFLNEEKRFTLSNPLLHSINVAKTPEPFSKKWLMQVFKTNTASRLMTLIAHVQQNLTDGVSIL